MNVLLYDAEIKKCIPSKKQKPQPDLQFCKNWRDYKGMGISTVSWAWLDSELSYAFDWEDEVKRGFFVDAVKFADVVAGFGSRVFDDKLLQAHGVDIQTHYDILEEIRFAAFGHTTRKGIPQRYSYKLDAIANANGMAKTGNGALAPELWQQGFRQDVLDYCRNDVIIERGVMRLLLDGKLVDPNTGRMLKGRPLMVEAK